VGRDPRQALGQVDPRWDAERTERALTALHRRRARRRATTVLAIGAVLGCVALVSAWSFAGDTQGPATVARQPADRVVRLADGSRIVPGANADVVVERVTDALVSVRVERGEADVEVVPGRPRRFEVTVGAVTVTVLGTRFHVERLDRDRARVSVQRGHVAVTWASGRVELHAGEEGTFPPVEMAAGRRPDAVEPEALVEADVPQEIAAPAEDETEPRSVRRPPEAREDWRQLAHASRYDDAYEAFHASDEAPRQVRDAVDDLLLAADVARLSGHPAEALPWLERVERDHAGDARAPLAAFTRGRILMELGRAAEAAGQLERVLAMEPAGSLAEDALARAALAHAAAGRSGRAAELGSQYLEAHPGGRWATRMRAIGGRIPAPE
jgi:transmembrane sensor